MRRRKKWNKLTNGEKASKRLERHCAACGKRQSVRHNAFDICCLHLQIQCEWIVVQKHFVSANYRNSGIITVRA